MWWYLRNFKHISVIYNKPRYKLVKTSNKDESFLMDFELVDGKIQTRFIKKFELSDMTF